jgi:hypothetical protein
MAQELGKALRRIYDYLLEKDHDTSLTWRYSSQYLLLAYDCPTLTEKFLNEVVEPHVMSLYGGARVRSPAETGLGGVWVTWSQTEWEELWEDTNVGDLLLLLGVDLFDHLFAKFKGERVAILEERYRSR